MGGGTKENLFKYSRVTIALVCKFAGSEKIDKI